MMNQSFLRLSCLVAILLIFTASVYAQLTNSESYAIKGATIVTVSGATIANGTVVIRNGLIAAVGADVNVPADARVIDGKGMTVYPGLIDAYSSYGIKPPTTPAGGGGGAPQGQFNTQNAGPTDAGLLPEISVNELLSVNAETFDQQRNAGITAALTSPRDGVFRGRSAFINLGTESGEKLLLRSPLALSIGFSGARGGYPGSLMGVFAFLRQSFLDAKNYQELWDNYGKSSRGKARPTHNKSMEALLPIISGKMPVIFNVTSEREIRRAISLGEEFNLKYMLSGAGQSYLIPELLKQKNATVLLSLGFPQKPAGLDDPESESLRILKDRAEAPKAAAALSKAGVKFAFTSGNLTRSGDFIANASKAIEAGLAKEEAIKALTLYPAQIFGLAEQLGSIEQGKIANLVVTTGDLFSKDTKIKYTFVDGRQFEVKAPELPRRPEGNGRGGPAPVGSSVNAAGSWILTINSPSGTMNAPLTLQVDRENVTGEMGTPSGNVAVSNGKLVGNELSFTYQINFQNQQLSVNAKGKIEGNSITGLMETMGTSFEFSGVRKP